MKHLTAILCMLILIASSPSHAQHFEWVKSFGSSNCTQGSWAITTDALGNVLTTGYGIGNIDFNPGPGVNYLNLGTDGNIFILKLDSHGDFVWARSFGTTPDVTEISYSIVTDPSGNIYTTGLFGGTVDFDPGPAVHNLTSVNGLDVFLLKLNSNGDFMWAESFVSYESMRCYNITLDLQGNIYTTGTFTGTIDFDPDMTGTYNLDAGASEDVFVQKLDADGNFLWARNFGGQSYTNGVSIVTDHSGNSYTAGTFVGTADFDPGTAIYNQTSAGSSDVFIVKLDPSGNLTWVRTFGSSFSDYICSVDLDAAGNIYSTGAFTDNTDLDPGPGIDSHTSVGSYDAFVQKLDPSGNFIWAKSFGGSGMEHLNSLVVDASGNTYTHGVFYGAVDFDPGSDSTILNSQWEDVYIQKLDPDGNFLWVETFGGNSQEWSRAIHIDSLENIYATGHFGSTVDFDNGPGNSSLTALGIGDIYILKLNQSTAGLHVLKQDMQLTVFPNPSNGTIHLSAEKEWNDVKLILTDVRGKVIWTASDDFLKTETLELPETGGIYFLNIYSMDEQQTVKVIRE